MSVAAPHVTLRSPEPALIALPWAKPLRDWASPEVELVPLEVGPSRHLVRFVRVAGRLLAIKELPAPLVEREFAILRRLESAGMPAVTPVGAVDRGDGEGFIITDYLPRAGEAFAELAPWVMEGKIKWKAFAVDGLENAAEAVKRLFTGDHDGKLLIRISPEP
jgi:NADPH:quinone reductase-like Zn-dependent oxidoreductase